MRIEQAIVILHDYQMWRRDNHVPNKHPMPSPKRIGEAIDCAIHNLRICVQIDSVVMAYDNLKECIERDKRDEKF